ncbi:hypothetical protein DM02DRAFT_649532 [Periconia macrospinosa]|uniref:protein-histidine N-methyltransferase n=1 Tax=Periconia macrospinosa TaxID=97972 RepID=A0A2V1EC22_9PLEO|nr:hypothetical protein DM02DRAFT_649532 [Periconia macrospinosa]
MSFSFGFSGDDIEEDVHNVPSTSNQNDATATTSNAPPPIPAQTHDLGELLATLPSKIAYNVFTTTSPNGRTARIPRRELFDVRLQIMAEDDGSSENPLSGLETTDLLPSIYEGGYKTWECSIDLVRLLLDRGPRKDLDDLVRVDHVIEMGCGTALPSLLLFQYAIANKLGMYFTLTDYNIDVLRLVTVPNLLLNWAASLDDATSQRVFGDDAENPLVGVSGFEDDTATTTTNITTSSSSSSSSAPQQGTEIEGGELHITPSLLTHFTAHLSSISLTPTLLSGSWTPLASLLPLIPSSPNLNTFLLASETIYSPSSLSAFTQAMAALLKRVKEGKALVAAKRVYFGVGGSVDGFREECSKVGCVAGEVEFEGLEMGGVRRAILEVQVC